MKTQYKDIVEELSLFIETEIEQFDIRALSIAIIENQTIFWQAGFGWQNREQNVKVSEQTVFRVGSISKLFTAVAIMQLYEKGKLEIDKPIADLCPELTFENPFQGEHPITLRHLISHRAGILRESPVGNYFDDSEPTIKDTVLSIVGKELILPVNSKYKYSNLGPTVAGYILEKVTRLSFPKYLQQFILNPLGMKYSSFVLENPVIAQNLASAFMVHFDGSYFPAPQFALGTLPAGNLYSTVNDLGIFMMCLFNDGEYNGFRMLKKDTLQEMFRVQAKQEEPPPQFGLGFAIGKLGNSRAFWHNGMVYGFAADFMGLLDEKLGVVVMNNVDGANGFNEKVKLKVFHLLLTNRGANNYPSFPKIIAQDHNRLNDYSGKYTSKKLIAWVFVKHNRLYLTSMGITKWIRRIDTDLFVSDDRLSFGLRVQFTCDENDKICTMNIGNVRYEKVSSEIATDSIPTNWQLFIGDYGWQHNIMRIYVKDNQLTCLIEWFYEYPLLQINSTTFVFPNYGLYEGEKIQFVLNENGEVIKAIAGMVHFHRLSKKS